ncbi:hypothetical protein SAMN05216417_11253 [Nitrosospira multiformis]|jgi:hypothetical protein|uniref:Uncharacterized protein n=1 Tax=Nitrosospira multiformis TaxID=1231 RepID=A0A1I7HWL4_9PROT|nr:hypothetical protein SAMN05216417_11253 [Nitrosospira multiformis]
MEAPSLLFLYKQKFSADFSGDECLLIRLQALVFSLPPELKNDFASLLLGILRIPSLKAST